MPASIQTTTHDHIPEDFNLDDMKAHLSEAEIAAISEGDDPVLSVSEDGTMAYLDAPAPAAEEPAAPTQPAAPAQEAAQPVQYQPVPPTTEAQAAIAQLDEALNTLAEKYDMGEIDRAEMMAEQKRIAQEQARAQLQIEQANQIAQQNHSARLKAWNDAQATFYTANDASFLLAEQNIGAWDSALKSVNGQYGDTLSFDRQIELAYELLSSHVKASTGKPLPALKAGAANPAAKKGEPRTDEREAPTTLAGFNSDTTATITDGTFAAIDRMMEKDPIAAEKMLMRLPADQQAAYLENV